MKKWLVRILVIVLLAAGLLLIFSPFIKENLIGLLSTRFGHQKVTAGQLEKNNGRNATFDFGTIQAPSLLDTLTGSMQQDPKAMIGRITVQSVGIRLPIMKGTTNSNLLLGATTMRSDQKMGEGNYPLAGHHMRQSGLLFGPLMRVKVGARIVITNLKQDYIYQVTSREIVSETQGNVVAQTNDRRVTLITCDKPTRTPNRLVVSGKLIQVAKHQGK
ncbi:class A sortase [Sporolactobacillus vineae]|uniref:class A sortase n=1 Tax=Sporolactobacillus vineae TaxID=444463 RepID=UPI000289C6D8|nr:class A sortase [Sporolactobacillus vineae]